MSELSLFSGRLGELTSSPALKRIATKAGMAGKQSALDAAAKDLGGDRAMSGLRGGRARLSAGYDAVGSTQVQVNFRGPWKLAESGRRGTKPIRPRRRRAVLTPLGPRARSTSKPSRGLKTYTDAIADAKREVPRVAFRQFQAEIRKLVR